MRALIFGGTGMLGRAVVTEVRRRGGAALGLSHAQGDITDRDRLVSRVARRLCEMLRAHLGSDSTQLGSTAG